ncbi:amino acid permease [Amphibacillus xylanus]|uniref:Putative amino acid transporter n=1 Tax=Amphibacillus xylanus (strain ATCC 51415 / DSM 6626 / JCM 7361 / LMG 17667 / NBRC 15112 / Ep01) TaxID=698758 RepID=K0IYI0_AMPXN|nr:amino acid permease [Amphibacillus xylanus]BAM47504.1 putative amino acid transporter [Amphibacillus xylanus NBRC 15112]
MDNNQTNMKKNLKTIDLVLLGLGAVVGTGIFVITGTAANEYAGPGLVFSFLIAGIVIIMIGLCYAELSSRLPLAGGPYAYMLAIAGKRIAWIAGWLTIWEYLLASASVASGWSGYVNGFLEGLGMPLPTIFQASFNAEAGTYVDLIAIIMTLLVTWLVSQETKKALRLNNMLFFLKFIIIALFILIGMFYINPENWTPVMPYGLSGVTSGATLVFFAFLGFDSISMSAEEVKNPQKSLPRGILIAIGISTLLYILVTLVLTGIVPYTNLGVKDPVAFALRYVDQGLIAAVISVGAIITLLTVLIAMLYGLARLLYAMSKGKLLPSYLSQLNQQTQTPQKATWAAGLIAAVFSGVIPLQSLAELTNLVTLVVMMMLAIGLIYLRKQKGEPTKDEFRVPWVPFIPIITVLITFYLILQLSYTTWVMFGFCMLLGIMIYLIHVKKIDNV